jgi:hypothetical protein
MAFDCLIYLGAICLTSKAIVLSTSPSKLLKITVTVCGVITLFVVAFIKGFLKLYLVADERTYELQLVVVPKGQSTAFTWIGEPYVKVKSSSAT